jgi:acetyl esterase/lipase
MIKVQRATGVGRAFGAPRALLDETHGRPPHLLLVGDNDPLADWDALDRTTKALPALRAAGGDSVVVTSPDYVVTPRRGCTTPPRPA